MSLFISKIFFLAAVSLLLPFLVLGRSCCCQCPSHPCVHILAGGFTYWIVEWGILQYTIGLSDYGYRIVIFFRYRTIGISNVLENSRNYRTIIYRIKASIYQTIGYRTQKKTIGCPPLPTALKTF
jgi:hypothetical protein